jgi:Helix-turn-helix domain
MEALGVRYCPRPPVFWFGHPSVGPNELAVLMVLLAHSAPDGTCWPSQGRIAALLKRSRPWANAVLTRLAETGLVMSIQRSLSKGGRTSCLYRLVGVDRSGSEQAKEEHDVTCLSADTPCYAADTNMSHTKPNDSLSRARGRMFLEARMKRAWEGRGTVFPPTGCPLPPMPLGRKRDAPTSMCWRSPRPSC